MFTSLQSIQIAQEIQADHRRRASLWRTTRSRRRSTPELPVTRPLVLVRDQT
jgi:hypothetical protein